MTPARVADVPSAPALPRAEGESQSEGTARLVVVISLLAGCLLTAAKLVAGLLTGSLALVSEALHSLLDLGASGLAFVAMRAAHRPADREHPYGHGRAENLAAFVEGVVLLITAGGVGAAAVEHLASGYSAVNPTGYALAITVGAVVIEGARAVALRRASRAVASEALAADAENRLADVASSLAVLFGLLAVKAGTPAADAAAALLVAAVLTFSASRILARSASILIDRSVPGAEEKVRAAVEGVDGVNEVRAVRVRRSGPHLLAEARVAARRTLSVEAAQSLSEEVRRAAAAILPNLELTLVVEAQPRDWDLVERIHAAAQRHDRVRDLHNVTVEREADGSLHLSMHAKLPGDINLRAAAAISADLERVLRGELHGVSRVDVHLEPLEPPVVTGSNVTVARAALAARVRKLTEEHEEVRACRDVELSSRSGRITAHVVALMAGATTLERAHQVETEIEESVRHELPELDLVIVRAAV